VSSVIALAGSLLYIHRMSPLTLTWDTGAFLRGRGLFQRHVTNLELCPDGDLVTYTRREHHRWECEIENVT